MKALVDQLSSELTSRYRGYLETFPVDLWSEAGFIEFRCGFSLRRDHILRSFVIKVEADVGETDAQREMLTIVVFDEIEERIDIAIAAAAEVCN